MVPVEQAVQMTLSGQYPCAICKAIAKKKSSDQQKALVLKKHDKKFLTHIIVNSVCLNCSPVIYFETTQSLHFRNDSPSVPPPRSTLI